MNCKCIRNSNKRWNTIDNSINNFTSEHCENLTVNLKTSFVLHCLQFTTITGVIIRF